MKPPYQRRIFFAETDAAGVVYFANFLSFCHEAYEEALRYSGIELNELFRENQIIIPIAHAECDYFRPLVCGDLIEIELSVEMTKPESFSITYNLFKLSPQRKQVAAARTDHVCIDAETRKRHPLPGSFLIFTRAYPKS